LSERVARLDALRALDISSNRITTLAPLAPLARLAVLLADKNRIAVDEFCTLPSLIQVHTSLSAVDTRFLFVCASADQPALLIAKRIRVVLRCFPLRIDRLQANRHSILSIATVVGVEQRSRRAAAGATRMRRSGSFRPRPQSARGNACRHFTTGFARTIGYTGQSGLLFVVVGFVLCGLCCRFCFLFCFVFVFVLASARCYCVSSVTKLKFFRIQQLTNNDLL
jgi:hypothetical protein